VDVLLTLLATLVFALVALGVGIFGRTPAEMLGLGLALYAAAHLAWKERGTP
jgi:hypothetical protein